jgi:ABC-type antimicrobial peptide transport system permease subunit
VSVNQAIPGGGSYRGREFYSLSDTTRKLQAQLLEIYTATDYFRVFRHTRRDGVEAVRMSDFDWTGSRPVVISHSVADKFFPDGKAVGQQLVYRLDDTSDPMTVIGVIDDTKRFDYLRPRHAVYLPIQGMDAWDLKFWGNYPAISIRSNASLPDSRFAETFGNDMARDLHAGNFLFKGIVAGEKIAEDTDSIFGIDSDLKVRIYLMAFFLLNILLCVLGTFWYKVNIRRSEIGLRKAMGASAAGIRRELFTEGLCLLTAAAVVAVFIEAHAVGADVIDTFGKGWGADTDAVYIVDRKALRFLITNGITAAVLAGIILTAIALPARRAAAMHPAEALRDN